MSTCTDQSLYPNYNVSELIAKPRYNTVLESAFCEGNLLPFLVPPFFEVFSAATGLFLLLVGIAGTLQPRLEPLIKLIYSSITVSGLGTFALHSQRLHIYNYADVFPIIITLSIGIIALMDEVIFEIRRVRAADGNLQASFRNTKAGYSKLVLRAINIERAILDTLFYTATVAYLVIGLMLVVFSDEIFEFDIVAVYFGVTFAVCAVGGLLYLTCVRPEPDPEKKKRINKCRNLALIFGTLSAAFKAIDSLACNNITVFMFPHPLFHIFIAYSTHCFCCVLAFYRVNNYLLHGEAQPDLHFFLCGIWPRIEIPHRGIRSGPHFMSKKSGAGEAEEDRLVSTPKINSGATKASTAIAPLDKPL